MGVGKFLFFYYVINALKLLVLTINEVIMPNIAIKFQYKHKYLSVFPEFL